MSKPLKESTATHLPGTDTLTLTSTELVAATEPDFDEHAWKSIEPMMRFGVRLAGTLFCGVLILAFFLVPFALLANGWTPSP
jgi:hypothetical protein